MKKIKRIFVFTLKFLIHISKPKKAIQSYIEQIPKQRLNYIHLFI